MKKSNMKVLSMPKREENEEQYKGLKEQKEKKSHGNYFLKKKLRVGK